MQNLHEATRSENRLVRHATRARTQASPSQLPSITILTRQCDLRLPTVTRLLTSSSTVHDEASRETVPDQSLCICLRQQPGKGLL